MKKFLPLIFLLVGIVVLGGAFAFTKLKGGSNEEAPVDDESYLIEVPLGERPVVSLTPRTDGHWLDLSVGKILIDAETLEYELLYSLPDGRIQGVPGRQKIEGKSSLSIELLLGSESSGKFRYDEGVEKGSLSLKFRNSEGKLVAKFKTEFRMQSDEVELKSADNDFIYTLDEEPSGFFVTMGTIGYPEGLDFVPSKEVYGVFASDKVNANGSLNLSNSYVWDGTSWTELTERNSETLGIFASK